MISPIPSPSSLPPPSSINSIKPAGGTIIITRSLFKGFKHAEVKLLQEFLIAEGFLAQGNNTAFFGNLTESAVKVFQCKHGIICTGTSLTTGWGIIGPRTQVFLKQGSRVSSDSEHRSALQDQLRALQQQVERLRGR